MQYPTDSGAPSPPPKVSVVVPCYNSSAYLAQTVHSVLQQTLSDYELVLVDDGSTDDTPDLIDSLILQAPGHCLRKLTKANGGLASARNCGISAARGEYVLPLDADDLIAPGMLRDCAGLLDADRALALVYTDREDFGDVQALHASGRFELGRLKYFNQISYCSLYRRSMWAAIGGYRENVSGFDDWDFWVAAAARGFRGHHLPQPHLRHRRRRSSLLWTILHDYERLHARIVLNNAEAYSAEEIALSENCLTTGMPAPMATISKFVFLGRYYDGYPISGTPSA